MRQTLTTNQAADLLVADDHAGWSYAGARALVEYLENLERDTGEIEFDRVALRCDFSEYESAREAAEECGWKQPDEDADSEGAEEAALEWLNDRTTVIEFSGGVIVRQF